MIQELNVDISMLFFQVGPNSWFFNTQILSYRQYFTVDLLYWDESDIASRWVQKESNLMFTLSSIKDQRKISRSHSVNEPLGDGRIKSALLHGTFK